MTLPHGAWVGLNCVIVVFPDHTYLCFGLQCMNAVFPDHIHLLFQM